MKTREFLTLVLGLAAVAGLVATVKMKESTRSGAASPEITSAGSPGGSAVRQPPHSDTTKLLQNGPANTERTLNQYETKAGLYIMIDKVFLKVIRARRRSRVSCLCRCRIGQRG